MKKLLFVFGLMLSMVACTGNKTTETVSVEDSLADSVVVDSVDTIVADSINY